MATTNGTPVLPTSTSTPLPTDESALLLQRASAIRLRGDLVKYQESLLALQNAVIAAQRAPQISDDDHAALTNLRLQVRNELNLCKTREVRLLNTFGDP